MVKRFWGWISCTDSKGLGSILQGHGNILIGVGSIIAFYRTDEVLNKVLEIKKLSEETNQTIAHLASEFKSAIANRALESVQSIKTPKPSHEAIKRALSFIPSYPEWGQTEVILPNDVRDETITQLQKANDVSQKKKILMRYLKYVPGSGQGVSEQNIEQSGKDVPDHAYTQQKDFTRQ